MLPLASIAAAQAAPTGVTAVAVSDMQINLSWTDAPDEDAYTIWRNGAEWTTVAPNTTSISDTGRLPNTTYSYYIRSWWSDPYNQFGFASATASATTKPIHGWSTTHTVTGPTNGMTMTNYSFTAGGAACNWGHSMQYQFSWGDTSWGPWGAGTQSHAWTFSSSFQVSARAMCAGNLTTGYVNGPIITIGSHAVNAPATLTGTTSGNTGAFYSYIAANATDTLAHAISFYQFDWGDGTVSGWGAATQSHSWSSGGTFVVKAQALCSGGLVSAWSTTTVTVSIIAPHTLTTPSTPSGTASGITGNSYAFTTGSSTCNQGHAVSLYQLDWGDGTIGAWGSSTQSHTWTLNATYSVRAHAQCSAGQSSSWSGALSVTMSSHALTQPSTPSGTLNGSTGQSYPYSTGSSTCNQAHAVQYRFDWGDGSPQMLGSGIQSHTWSTAGSFGVKAQAQCSAGIVSQWSNTVFVSITAPAAGPATPTGLTATAISSSRIDIAWAAVSGATGYNVWRLYNSNWWDLGNTAATTFSDIGLVSGAQFGYRVRAYDGAGNYSGYSLTATATTPTTHTVSAPSIPSGPGSGFSGTSLTFSTGGSTCSLGHSTIRYRFYWGDASAFSIFSTSTSASHTYTAAGTYYVWAQAYCATSAYPQSNWSSWWRVVVTAPSDTIPPTTPTGLAATSASSTQINLSWTASTDSGGSGLAGYKIERSTDNINFSEITTTAGTTYSNTGLTTGTTYYYRVRAYDGAGNNSLGYSNTASAVPVNHTVSTPAQPTGFTHGIVGAGYSYSTFGSTCTLGHTVKYRFSWGDGSPLTSFSQASSAVHAFSAEGTFSVSVQATCTGSPYPQSFWSAGLLVVIQNCGTITGDNVNVPVYLPFPFKFGSTTYSTNWPLRVCSNGWISLSDSISTSGTPPANLPTGSVSNVIAGLWDNLLPTGGANGAITWAATSTYVAITWNAVAYNRNTSKHATFTITFRSDSTVDLTYGPVDLINDYCQGFQYSTSWGTTWGTDGFMPQNRTIQNFWCFSFNKPYQLIYGYKTDGTATNDPALVDTGRIDVVFVGEGFASSNVALFRNKTLAAADALRATEPFGSSHLNKFNFWRVMATSPSPYTRTMGVINRDTYNDLHVRDAASVSPGNNFMCVLVNDPNDISGSAQGVGSGSIIVWGGPNTTRFSQLFVHEFGHVIANLGDEYITERGFAKNYNESRDSATRTWNGSTTLSVFYTAPASPNPPKAFVVRPRELTASSGMADLYIYRCSGNTRLYPAVGIYPDRNFQYVSTLTLRGVTTSDHAPHEAPSPFSLSFTPSAPGETYEIALSSLNGTAELWVDIDIAAGQASDTSCPNLTFFPSTTTKVAAAQWELGAWDTLSSPAVKIHFYQGGDNNSGSYVGIWRPTRASCLMNHSGGTDPIRYCLVCRNGVNQRIAATYPGQYPN
ncbi:MAG: fibronectin type III domain-containing protein [Planctomycetes bacterium]|nr:fibronectin type III domain-containing protein [Planctomycetota bacterium]